MPGVNMECEKSKFVQSDTCQNGHVWDGKITICKRLIQTRVKYKVVQQTTRKIYTCQMKLFTFRYVSICTRVRLKFCSFPPVKRRVTWEFPQNATCQNGHVSQAYLNIGYAYSMRDVNLSSWSICTSFNPKIEKSGRFQFGNSCAVSRCTVLILGNGIKKFIVDWEGYMKVIWLEVL